MGMRTDGMAADISGWAGTWSGSGIMLTVATEPHQVSELGHRRHGDVPDQGAARGWRRQMYLAGLFESSSVAIVHPAKLALELASCCRGCADSRAHLGAVAAGDGSGTGGHRAAMIIPSG